MALADGVAYIALLSRIGPAALAVTTNLNINFLRRPRPVDLVADARILKLGRTLALCDVLLYSDGGGPDDLERPVAQSVVTYSMALLTPPPDTGEHSP
jgi:acyl-coenzyme A thioesterase PaaI-like protein